MPDNLKDGTVFQRVPIASEARVDEIRSRLVYLLSVGGSVQYIEDISDLLAWIDKLENTINEFTLETYKA